MLDGTIVSSPAALRQVLMKRPEQFVGTMTEKLLTYALGRSVAYYDMPAVRGIVRESARNNYTVLVNDPGHRQERAIPDATGAGRGTLDEFENARIECRIERI